MNKENKQIETDKTRLAEIEKLRRDMKMSIDNEMRMFEVKRTLERQGYSTSFMTDADSLARKKEKQQKWAARRRLVIQNILKAFKKLFGSNRHQASVVSKSPDTTHVLVCGGCGKTYSIGEDAIVMTTEIAKRNLESSGSFVIQLGTTANQADVVYSCEDEPVDSKGKLLSQAREIFLAIREGISQGQDRNWVCRACKKTNSYPAAFRPDSSPTASRYKEPSEGYYRELSRSLTVKHGPLMRITNVGAAYIRWKLMYQDGTALTAGCIGELDGFKLDIDFHVDEGHRFASAFFKQAGVDTSHYEIFNLEEGRSLEVRDGKTIQA